MIFTLGIVTAEVFIYLRWRFSVICTYCGFDPVLYRKSPELASKKVRAFYEEKIKDPQFLLSKSPLLELYRKSQEIKRRNDRVNSMTTAAMELKKGAKPAPPPPAERNP